jgi:hypothetical protein
MLYSGAPNGLWTVLTIYTCKHLVPPELFSEILLRAILCDDKHLTDSHY